MLFLTLATLAPASAQSTAQTPQALPKVNPQALGIVPTEVDHRFAALRSNVRPSAWDWIAKQARVEANRPKLDAESLKSAITAHFGSQLPAAEVEAISFLVLEQANRDLENDMRAALAQSPVTSQAPSQPKDDSLRLQTLMDRRSKVIETLSNVMKAMGDTQSTIVGNLK
jgi:hypothetical protein